MGEHPGRCPERLLERGVVVGYLRLMRACATLCAILMTSGCVLAGRNALRIEFPTLPLKVGEVVIFADASVECNSDLGWQPLVAGWVEKAERDGDLSSVRVSFGADVIEVGDFTSFTQSDGKLPALLVKRAGEGCDLWAIEVEVGPIDSDPGSFGNAMLMLDYASHGQWYREVLVKAE